MSRPPTIQELQTQVGLVQAALALPGAKVTGTNDNGLAFSTLRNTAARIDQGMQSAESRMAFLAALGAPGDGFFASDTAANAVLAVNAAASLAGYMAYVMQARGHLGRAWMTLAGAST